MKVGGVVGDGLAAALVAGVRLVADAAGVADVEADADVDVDAVAGTAPTSTTFPLTSSAWVTLLPPGPVWSDRPANSGIRNPTATNSTTTAAATRTYRSLTLRASSSTAVVVSPRCGSGGVTGASPPR